MWFTSNTCTNRAQLIGKNTFDCSQVLICEKRFYGNIADWQQIIMDSETEVQCIWAKPMPIETNLIIVTYSSVFCSLRASGMLALWR